MQARRQRNQCHQDDERRGEFLALGHLADDERTHHADADDSRHMPDAAQGDAELQPPVPHQAEETAPQFDQPMADGVNGAAMTERLRSSVMGEALALTATASSRSSTVSAMAVRPRRRDLIGHQSGVGAVSADELSMRAALDDRAIFQTTMRSASMTLDSRCAMISVVRPPSGVPAPLESGPRSRYRRATGLRRVGESAHLSAGRGQWRCVGAGRLKPQATFPDDRLIAQRQRLDEVMGIGGPRCLLQLLLGSIGFAKAQIVRHGAMDQVSVLHDHRDMAAQHFKRQATNIVAAADAPLLRIKEAQQSQIMVDLPAPLGPTSPTCSPGLMVSEMCFNTSGRLG